jgi:hypothetical protein
MRKIVLPIILFLPLFFFLRDVAASDTGAVNATVTAQNVSISVTDGAIAYGTLATSGTKSTLASEANDQQVGLNNGNITETFNIVGSTSAGWTLGGTAGVNQYFHKFCLTACTSPANFTTAGTALTTNYQALVASVAAGASNPFNLQVGTPSSTTVYTSQSVNVTVQAVP